MRLLLDTQIVIWTVENSRHMPKQGRRLIERADAVFVSAASLFEISMKASIGKLKAPMGQLNDRLTAANFIQIAVSWEHAIRAHDIAAGHPDPFDRLLLAQAVSEPLHFLTADGELAQYSDLVIAV